MSFLYEYERTSFGNAFITKRFILVRSSMLFFSFENTVLRGLCYVSQKSHCIYACGFEEEKRI